MIFFSVMAALACFYPAYLTAQLVGDRSPLLSSVLIAMGVGGALLCLIWIPEVLEDENP